MSDITVSGSVKLRIGCADDSYLYAQSVTPHLGRDLVKSWNLNSNSCTISQVTFRPPF